MSCFWIEDVEFNTSS